jgi:protein phosphatase PTC7
MYAANLGDSGYLIYRNEKIIHKSKEQTHAFNTPYQLTLLPDNLDLNLFIKDTPEHCDFHKLELETGDVILLATDGLWDNMPDLQILEVCF